MPDGLALPVITLAAAGLIALALVWPQGQGAPSPAPFGHRVAAPSAQLVESLKQQALRVEALKHPLAALRDAQAAPKGAPPKPASPSR